MFWVKFTDNTTREFDADKATGSGDGGDIILSRGGKDVGRIATASIAAIVEVAQPAKVNPSPVKLERDGLSLCKILWSLEYKTELTINGTTGRVVGIQRDAWADTTFFVALFVTAEQKTVNEMVSL